MIRHGMCSIRVGATGLFLSLLMPLQAQPTQDRKAIPAGGEPDLRQALEGLYMPGAIGRANAAISLRKQPFANLKLALPFLATMLHDKAPLRIATAFNPLAGAPTSPGEEAARTMGLLGEHALPLFATALADDREHVRKCAAVGMGEAHLVQAVPLLLARLQVETEATVTRAILGALGRIPDSRVLRPLVAALSAADWETRKIAARGLADHSSLSPCLVPPLLGFLPDARNRDFEFFIVSQVETKLGMITKIHGRGKDEAWLAWAAGHPAECP